MQRSLQKHPRIKILPALSVNERPGLREVEIDEVIKTLQHALPQYVDGDDITITLVEKNLKIMADMSLMNEAITHLIRNAVPGCGKYSLTLNRVNFEIDSLLNGDDSIIGACAFISLTGVGKYICVDNQIKEKMLEPFFTTITDGNGRGFALAYRIIKQDQGKIKVKNRMEQSTEANIYLPLTNLEIVNMMSISAG